MITKLLSLLIKFAVGLRYRITIQGLEDVKGVKGHLILPNHVSLLEPVVVGSVLWDSLKPRPVITQPYFDLSCFKPIFDRMRAISAPHFINGTNKEKIYHLEVCLQSVLDGIDQGDNVLFYPAGRLKLQEEERVDGSSGLFKLLQRKGELDVIFLRITGLWGSSFSNAPHGKTPNLVKSLLKSIFTIATNLIFFMPKRDVQIVLEKKQLKLSSFPDKRSLNHHLEAWYNQVGDPFFSPPYHFLFRNRPLQRVLFSPPVQVKDPAILEEVLQRIETISGKKIGPKDHLAYDLGLDSLQISELFVLLQEKYALRDLFTTELATAEHVAAMIEESWVPKRIEHERQKLDKKLRKFLKNKAACLDEIFGLMDLRAIGGKIRAWKKVFEQDVSQQIHLLIEGGIDAYAAAVGAFYANKVPKFLSPKEVEQYQNVYTTKQTIVRWHEPSMNHSQGVLKYLPDSFSPMKWEWKPIPKEDEAARFLKGKKMCVNTLFKKDPLLFVATTHYALKNHIQVAIPFAGVPNLSWSRRVAAYFNYEI